MSKKWVFNDCADCPLLHRDVVGDRLYCLKSRQKIQRLVSPKAFIVIPKWCEMPDD